ncbi:Bacterial type II secretion system protein N [Idiomarina sp. A28L]|uniref:type II secretion system protein N n=1 Tax=Idiomarina sp. A28L TaxID=1036674 RepID=UPI0002138DFE|nr:type II secretion system protein N [Idiomarina sp. A28L]EGN74712.1 Bacterial type II secretion system protein N [Idiomarina sp. A28L]
MIKNWQLISLVVVVYLFGLIVLFPAKVAVALAPVPENVEIGRVDGSIWNGSIERVNSQGLSFYNVSWRLNPLALLRLRAQADITIPSHPSNIVQGAAQIQASSDALIVSNANFAADLEDMLVLSPVSSPIPLRGGVSMNIASFELGSPICNALVGQIFAMQVQARFGAQWENLGDYETNLGCSEGRISIEMPDNNLLGLSVNGNVAPTGIDLRIGIAPKEGAPQGIRDLMQWLGQADSQGRRYFNFRL